MSYAEIKSSDVRRLAVEMMAQIDGYRKEEVAELERKAKRAWLFRPDSWDFALARNKYGGQYARCRRIVGLCDLAGPDANIKVSADDIGTLGLPASRDMEASNG